MKSMNLPVLRKFPILPILLLGGSILVTSLALGQATLNLTDKLTLNPTGSGPNTAEMRADGTLASLSQKWFGLDLSTVA